MAVNFPRTPADAPVVPPDVPDYDDEASHCKECGSPWGKHVRIGLDPDIDIECPDPERYTGRWVGTWPESE